MKKLNVFFVIAMMVILLSNCKKDEEAAFVDGYVPALTEAAGVEYNGNFYPMEVGYQWNWSGTGSVNMNVSGQVISEDDQYVAGHMWVRELVNMDLGGVNYDLLRTDETDGMIRYFDKQNNAVFMRAFKQSASSSVVQVENPVYLKSPLVVGDSWETHPQMDYNSIMSEGSVLTDGNVDIDMKCMFYVVGKENINLNGTDTETLRLDQRAEVNGTITSTEGNMSFNIKMTINLNLQENVGLVAQNLDMVMAMNGTINYEGADYPFSMTMDMDSNITLDSFYISSSSYAPSADVKEKDGRVLGPLGKVETEIVEVAENLVKHISKTSL